MIKKIKIENVALVLATLCIYSFYFYRNDNLYLLNPPDEYSFKILIFNTTIKNFDFSSPLYVFIFKIITLFEENFYKIAKILNLLFFLIGNIFVYKISIKVTQINYSKFLFLISSLSTYNFYSSALMPEMIFYMYFYIFIYLYFFMKNFYFKYIVCSTNIFILFLLKGTGIFILPAILLNEFFKFLKKNETPKNFFIKISIILTSFIVLFCLTKFFITKNSNFIFGSKYGSIFKEINNLAEIVYIFKIFINNYIGHLVYNFLIFGLPIFFIIKNLFLKNNKLNEIIFLPFFILILFSIFSSLNHAMHVYTDSNINLFRVTTRYYDFIIPLMLMSCFFITNSIIQIKKKRNIIIILLISLIYILIFYSQIINFRPTSVIFDSILFRGYIYNDFFFNFLVFFSLVCFLVNFIFPQKTYKVFLFLYFPIVLIISSIPISKEINTYKKPNKFDNVGIILKKHYKSLGEEPTIISDKLIGEDYRVLFFLNSPNVKITDKNNINNTIIKSKNILLINNHNEFKNSNYKSYLNERYILIKN